VKRPVASSEETAPKSFPEVTPREVQHGHDWTLQAIMEMKGSLGELIAEVRRLSSDMKSTSDKLDAVRLRLAWLAGAAAVVGALVGLLLTVAVIVFRLWPGA
jgi:hypothetical protein